MIVERIGRRAATGVVGSFNNREPTNVPVRKYIASVTHNLFGWELVLRLVAHNDEVTTVASANSSYLMQQLSHSPQHCPAPMLGGDTKKMSQDRKECISIMCKRFIVISYDKTYVQPYALSLALGWPS